MPFFPASSFATTTPSIPFPLLSPSFREARGSQGRVALVVFAPGPAPLLDLGVTLVAYFEGELPVARSLRAPEPVSSHLASTASRRRTPPIDHRGDSAGSVRHPSSSLRRAFSWVCAVRWRRPRADFAGDRRGRGRPPGFSKFSFAALNALAQWASRTACRARRRDLRRSQTEASGLLVFLADADHAHRDVDLRPGGLLEAVPAQDASDFLRLAIAVSLRRSPSASATPRRPRSCHRRARRVAGRAPRGASRGPGRCRVFSVARVLRLSNLLGPGAGPGLARSPSRAASGCRRFPRGCCR